MNSGTATEAVTCKDSGVPADRADTATRPVVERVAGWSARHRALALIGWLLLVSGAVMLSSAIGTKNLNSYDPGEAGRAERVLARPGVVQRPTESILIQARQPGRTVAADPELRQAAAQVVTALRALPSAAIGIRSPLPGAGGDRGLISADGRSELVTFTVAGAPGSADQTVTAAQRAVVAVQARHPDLLIAEAGTASIGRATNDIIAADFRRAEVTSLPVTLVLLLIVFGALLAAGIPLLLAGSSVTAAISLLAIPSHWLPISSTTSSVVLLVGMAVGVDYSLFYLRRVREERAGGASTRQALAVAAATSGRAIVVSGLTVMISLAGLFLTGIDIFTGFAIGTITVVGVAVLGSLTALPALLAWLGDRANRSAVPFLGRHRTSAPPSRFWAVLVRRVVARPAIWGGTAAVALLALAAPAAGMRLADPGLHDLPAGIPVVRNLLEIQHAFPGGPVPAQIVVTGRDLGGSRVQAAVGELARRATTGGPLRNPVTASLLDQGAVLVVSVPLAGDGTNATSSRALSYLRDRALPATLGRVGGIGYAVTGITAGDHDFTTRLHGRLPIVFAFVLGLAFCLMLATFRSVAVAAISIALNLLSVGAAYGVLTLVFQNGLASGPIGFSPYGGIVPWMPLFLFVLLFGLSMDYHVFILSRIREHWLRGRSPAEAVTHGIAGSAGVVTSAAVIMIAVFSIFATLSVIEFKMFGVGLSAAVLIDATAVRGVLMPAALALAGERAWRSPRWLSRLPGLPQAPGTASPLEVRGPGDLPRPGTAGTTGSVPDQAAQTGQRH